MENIHITLTEFRSESRVLREVRALEKAGLFGSLSILALGASDLPANESISETIRVHRVSLFTRRLPRSTPFQLIKFIEFVARVLLIVFRKRGAVINIHALSLLPLGWLIKVLLNGRLVYDAHELETETNGLVGFKKWFARKIESHFITRCDLVIVVGECIADWYQREYAISRPLVVKNVPKHFRRSNGNLLREKLGISRDKKILLYQGGLTVSRGVPLVLEAFKNRKNDDVVVVFMGYGELSDTVKQVANASNNIYYMPAVEPESLLNFTSSADFGIHLIQNTCLNHYLCMPNKFFEYLMGGLPVIVSDMKEMAEAVQGFELGLVLNDFSSDEINRAIDSILDSDIDQMASNARKYACENSWEQQEEVMLDRIRKMLAE